MKTERIYLKEHFPELGVNGCNAYVDCYLPSPVEEWELEKKVYPGIIVCPGGGYNFTSVREGEPVGLQFLNEGYRVFVIHYSCKPNHFPQQLREVAAVMELIHKNQEAWKVNASDVAIVGFSAGGHLSCQYSNRYNCPEVREVFPDSKPVAAAILSYPVLVAGTEFSHEETICNFVGHEPTEKNESGCSCDMMVTENTPPTFLWHTAEDEIVHVNNSLIYAQALRAKEIPFELHIYPFGPHGLSTTDGLVCHEIPEEQLRARRWIEDAKSWLATMRKLRK